MRFISRVIMGLLGWKLEDGIPPGISKCVIIGAPHTSNWDLVFGLMALKIYRVKLKYLIKKESFFFPLNIFLRATGGIPVDRSKHHNLVDAMVELFDEHEELALMFTPEGTRSRVRQWKTGFYHVALQAKVPIMPGFIDYRKKMGGFGPPFYPTGDFKKDMEYLEGFYKGFQGKIPENFNPEIFVRE